jgi:hypothetical protein
VFRFVLVFGVLAALAYWLLGHTVSLILHHIAAGIQQQFNP